jgi:hypothetical protein
MPVKQKAVANNSTKFRKFLRVEVIMYAVLAIISIAPLILKWGFGIVVLP